MAMNFSEFNWQLISTIVVISVVVSYMGDVLGMKIGKKRISIFGLRPKYTSTIITILTGLGVAIITLFVAAYTSEPIRGAFFGVNYLDRQISQLNSDLRERQYQLDEMELDLYSSRQELARLNEEANLLKEGLAEMKEGRVIAFQGELLSQTSVNGNADRRGIADALDRLVELAEKSLADKEQTRPDEAPATKITISDEAREKIEDELLATDVRKVLRLTAPSNVVLGQTVEGVVHTFDSRLVYEDGTELLNHRVISKPSPEEAADLLYALLKQINRHAVARGVLPDPISGAVGNLDSMEFYEAADKLSEHDGEQVIKFFAAADIYTEGPVDIRVEIQQD